MSKPPIRTITLGLAEAHPLTGVTIARASAILAQAKKTYEDQGYEVQTVRLSTRPVFDDLAGWSAQDILTYTQELQKMLDDAGLSFCSLGPFNAVPVDFSEDRATLVAELLIATTALNASVQMVDLRGCVNLRAADAAARIILRLSRETAEGFGNFRFAMLACVRPGTPFFPAAYHEGPASISIGLQSAGLLAEILRYIKGKEGHRIHVESIGEMIEQFLGEEARNAIAVAKCVAKGRALQFGGIDLSPAPMGEDSIAAALELCGCGKFGEPGTLMLAAALTSALQRINVLTCGYCGLMLPVLEDAVLGQRWSEGMISIEKLLLYSSVCGTGLDTIPLPGDTSEETIARILSDVASLAARWRKPLSARLFPVPGKQRGERTTFTSPYLANTII